MGASPSVRYRTEPVGESDLFAKKPVNLILDNRVAFARSGLESGSFNDFNVSMTVPTDTITLKVDRGACNSGTAHAEQHRQKLMGNREGIRLKSVAHHQEPARAPCFHAMTRIA